MEVYILVIFMRWTSIIWETFWRRILPGYERKRRRNDQGAFLSRLTGETNAAEGADGILCAEADAEETVRMRGRGGEIIIVRHTRNFSNMLLNDWNGWSQEWERDNQETQMRLLNFVLKGFPIIWL